MSPARASGVITITTDFGHQGPFVGVMKGCILSRFADARIIDLTHEIVVHWPAEAGFWLARAFAYFPRRHGARRGRRSGCGHFARHHHRHGRGPSIFCAGQWTARAHCRAPPDATIVRLTPAALVRFGIEHASATFHGRDIFAPLAAELASGRCGPRTWASA
jgi:S-adenosylmethionine hydrolase